MKRKVRTERHQQKVHPGSTDPGQGHVINDDLTPGENLDPVDPDLEGGVEIERRVHLTKNDEEVDHETGNGEDILPGTDIDIRKREGGVEAEIDTARGATGVDPGTAAGHRTSIDLQRVEVTVEIGVITLHPHHPNQRGKNI